MTRKHEQSGKTHTKAQISLGSFVFIVIALVTIFGGIILAILLISLAKPDDINTANWLYELVLSVIALLGLITIGGGAAVAYRRQFTLEQQSGFEEIKNLHIRFQQASNQLGDDKPMVRIAGVYALEALADEWEQNNNPTQQDVCIDLLCAYLRTNPNITTAINNPKLSDQDNEIRDTIVTVINRHLHNPNDPNQPGNWSNHTYNFEGATFNNANFNEATFNEYSSFYRATFKNYANFEGATFNSYANFNETTFNKTNFERATFNKKSYFNEATFNEYSSFYRATFNEYSSFDGSNGREFVYCLDEVFLDLFED